MVTTGPKEFTETDYCCLHTIRYDQPKRLRNVTPAALYLEMYLICYTDMIYMLLVTGGLIGISQSLFTLQLDQFLSVYARVHIDIDIDILRSDFWKFFTSEISEK